VEDEPDRVVVTTVAERPAWLVLNDTYGPGWRASIDGRPAPLFRANALVRAVPVPAGRHEVGFAYRPASVRVGAAVSIAALAIVATLALAPFGRPGPVEAAPAASAGPRSEPPAR
jgi:uncharacterized membrane protein YfhO